MDKDTADRFKRRFGVYRREGGVNFVRAPSWELVALVAQASAEHLGRTVADLKSQVDTLKGRVGNLEVRINKLEKREKARRRALDRTK
ncbi:MAG: hypothetical protein GTO24_18615 [candidate division Zixibacteria bacterium]|nr:hypothetical protein [candidate division Zixibacteria bacterium]